MCSAENFWTRDSYMTISQEGGIMIGRYTLDKYYRREFKFQPHSVLEKGVHPGSTPAPTLRTGTRKDLMMPLGPLAPTSLSPTQTLSLATTARPFLSVI